jgi:hypothetical protein
MLALRPDLVHLDHSDPELADQVRSANAADGAARLERFAGSIVGAVRGL